MTNLISAQEAFNALQNGKEVLCSKLFENDFKTLESYPATIFVMPGYEFCIKPELMELSGIQFTKPLTPHDVEDNQEIFIVMPMQILRTKFDAENSEILCSVMNGFAQADAENATLQLKAIGATFGQVIGEVEIKDGFNDKPKKPRGKKEPQVKAEQSQVKEKPSEVISAETQPAIVITEQTNVTTSEDLLVPETSDPDIKPNVNAQFEILLDAIRICQSEKELDSTCANLEKEGFSPEQIKSIDDAKQNRLTELDAQEIDDVATTLMPENFESLVQSIQNAHTPEEVNSVVRYTSKWTEEQRKPLLNEMHKRLSELNQTKQQDDGLSPLIVRLQYAPDLNTLEELEREIPSRHPDVHKTLWNMAKKRRGELNAASTPSLDPDYLLGDNF
ncbi:MULTISPECIES: hypothetical protein [Acinetobacter calcoaceticus/baumannii complex]|uniref:Uncharacterized protein n=1 Tax=Acinetobacter baumannii TaxID=470 RepID=A0AB73FEC3_ACIBA|nr:MULTISPECIES: hypothetical protein [Acinetobacter calcoaceticus/baumannii complex]KQD19334.1 hypothetical protein APD06_16040 [Acinetobacter baumannii]KQD31609.1 hypothetical protein APD12_00690 [Acinetobacter pittii]KQF88058.1 hypothetical protein APC22_11845 [Acinetobacter pittii]MCI3941317.1 hypothetical protein [Acinetobacter baumannii]OTM25126.1 hypothetical protein B9X50_13455 [Acinetobacter baumannii]